MRTSALERPEAPLASAPCSSKVTRFTPDDASANAIYVPITPPPTTTTSAVSTIFGQRWSLRRGRLTLWTRRPSVAAVGLTYGVHDLAPRRPARALAGRRCRPHRLRLVDLGLGVLPRRPWGQQPDVDAPGFRERLGARLVIR